MVRPTWEESKTRPGVSRRASRRARELFASSRQVACARHYRKIARAVVERVAVLVVYVLAVAFFDAPLFHKGVAGAIAGGALVAALAGFAGVFCFIISHGSQSL